MELAPDPTVERLRDALGTLRSAYAAAPDGSARSALRQAAEELKGALDIATTSRRDKELGSRLRVARRALERAAQAAPWASPAILGALSRLPSVRGYP